MLTAIMIWIASNVLVAFWLAFGRYRFAAPRAKAAPMAKRSLFLMTDDGYRNLAGSVNQP